MIAPGLQVSTDPNADKIYFLCEGKLYRTSKEDIMQGGLCQIFHNIIVLGISRVWIMRSIFKCTFWDASNRLTYRLLNLERISWVHGLFFLFDRLQHYVISSPGRYIILDIHHVNIFN
jgi:hypothetical protein